QLREAPPDGLHAGLGQRAVHDAADVVGLEDLGGDGSHSGCTRNWKMRRGSQSMLPGKGPETNSTWPPSRGNSSLTADETSRSVGSAFSGRNGSSHAFSRSVGTAIALSHGLALARVQ